jgi:hypothetical protein
MRVDVKGEGAVRISVTRPTEPPLPISARNPKLRLGVCRITDKLILRKALLNSAAGYSLTPGPNGSFLAVFHGRAERLHFVPSTYLHK